MNEPREESHAGEEEASVRRWGWIVRCEEVLFLCILAALILAGLLPIAARFVGLPSFLWLDDLSEQMVLWIALLGAGAATRDRKHIDIDILGQFLPSRGRLALRAVMELAAAVLCGVLVPVAVAFVREEADLAPVAETFLEHCRNWLPVVIPLGLGLLTLRLLLAAGSDAWAAWVGRKGSGPA